MQSQQSGAGAPNLVFEKDVGIPVSDGLVLRANLFRPMAEGRYPVVLAMGIYGKDAHFGDAFKSQWDNLLRIYPDLCANGSSGHYLRWEVVDPERWVPDGYVVVNVDSRGSGKSPGYLDPFSPRETADYYDAIEWAAAQPWSNGKVGLIGISYFAIKQWQVAALQPPHLAAIVPWEGANDFYRDWSHHGGIFSSGFPTAWWPRQALVNQHGSGESTYRDRDTGERTTGPALSREMLAGSRTDHPADLYAHPLDDAWHRERTADLSRVMVPLLSAGNWGGPGIHLRGNVNGFLEAGAEHKWLSMHIGTHYDSFYLPAYVAMQKRFLGHFLKGEDNGWDRVPPVRLEVRRPDGASERFEQEWPLARTQWTPFHLDAGGLALSEQPAPEATASFTARGAGVDFATAPFAHETEFTGPLAAKLFVSSTTSDADLFLTLRLFDPAGQEVRFVGAHEPVPVARGWQRASHRKTDPERSLPYRPWHVHNEVQKLSPGAIYAVDVEIWPTSIVVPAGYRLVLTVQGRDFEYDGLPGRILHDHPGDRPEAEFGGTTTLHTGGAHAAHLLLPLIPN
ncbi:CocE/NonD family hydrolase [Aquabacter spiritensis]|uniref:Xaa-Pro dipeptidyl-peptidase C-terminal domain-containing protein n=1 Tax=Aquabacter spiritensis TaxID=933073 RepID=A0A4R3M5A9_9HYPH|nr:CocE/NonD family hydrolase [Aquabacter spiritensis]TCT08066.1 hypothetical protein EDC64_101585 [Aquabacter spiritensis]